MTSSAELLLDDGSDDAIATVMTGGARFRSRFRRERFALVALGYLIALVLVAAAADVVARHEPLGQDLSNTFAGPSAEHWLGTDELGRDTFARVVYAGRIALFAALQGVSIAAILGIPIGLFVGYRGGWWDRLVMRFVDTIIALPSLIVSIAILAALGPGLTNAMIALGVMLSTSFVRLTRGLVLSSREQLFVDAAQVTGVPTSRLLVRHVLPAIVPALVVQTTLACSTVLLAEAGLSFLGLGVQPPEASWGAMLSAAVKYINRDPFLVVPPGVMIMVTVLAFNLVGDGIRDALGYSTASAAARARARVPRPKGSQNRHNAAERSSNGRLLAVERLTVEFPGEGDRVNQVLDDVTFHVDPGEVVGLVGESGCGKSMTAMAIMGLIPPPGLITDGSIQLDGRELVGMSESALSGLRGSEIAMIFQEPSTALNPAFTVGDQLGEILRLRFGSSRSERRKRAVELLDLVGIPDAASRLSVYPHQLSGGMAQRVMIAMALAGRPRLLIADEPTTALDVTVQDQVLGLLRRLQDDLDMAMLFVSHDLGVIADICDRVLVMYAGQVVESSDIDPLFASPQHPYTQALLAAMPQNAPRAGRLAQIPGQVPPAWAWPAGCRFRPRCTHATSACLEQPPLEVHDGRHVRCVRVDEVMSTLRPVQQVTP